MLLSWKIVSFWSKNDNPRVGTLLKNSLMNGKSSRKSSADDSSDDDNDEMDLSTMNSNCSHNLLGSVERPQQQSYTFGGIANLHCPSP
ncbi:hypothetical protein QYF36_023015 [Acer negundo]|nr:hypothetical protein QYF36_023015 [Acer negundo]